MNIQESIRNYIASLPIGKQEDITALQARIDDIMPGSKIWFLDGKNSDGKVVSNPKIGYGQQTIKYANGDTKEFYRVGLSANTTGISVYLMGISDKNFLKKTYGERIGKAGVTGYGIKFKSLKDIDLNVLAEAIKYTAEQEL